jgi:hypothetical protein
MKKIEIFNCVDELVGKYLDLVWLARTHPDIPDQLAQKNIERILREHPDEVNAYIESENRDWQHGFNSGMLAGMRYVATLFYEDKETADEEFPFLDT